MLDSREYEGMVYIKSRLWTSLICKQILINIIIIINTEASICWRSELWEIMDLADRVHSEEINLLLMMILWKSLASQNTSQVREKMRERKMLLSWSVATKC